MAIYISDPIFTDIEKLREFLILNECLCSQNNCSKCTAEQKLTIGTINENFRIFYRCPVKGCQQRTSILSINMPPTKYIHLLYLLLSGSTYQQLEWWYGFSSASIARAKTALRNLYTRYINDRPVFIGGIGVVVEVDETVLSRRGVISNPTSLSDEQKDTVWIVGCIDNTPQRNFFKKSSK